MGGGVRGRRVQQVRKTSRSYHSTAGLAPDPQQPSAQLHTPASKTGVPGGLLSTLWLPKGPSGQVPPGSGPALAEGLVLALQATPATAHFRLLPSQEVETSSQPRPRRWVCFASWRLGLLPGFADALDVFSP